MKVDRKNTLLLERKIRSLLNRVQSKIKRCEPTDEASSSIGKELGATVIAYYLETASSSVTKIAGNGNDRDCERERNEWKKKAHEIISVLGSGNTNEGVVTGFFHGITSNALLAIQNSEATSETKSEAEGLDCEDLIHWYLQCITDCENNGHANVLNHAVRSYAKFASSYFTYSYLYHDADADADADAGKFKCHDHTVTIVMDGSNDYLHLANLYQKCTLPSTRKMLACECIHATFGRQGQSQSQSMSMRMVARFLSPLLCVSVVSASAPPRLTSSSSSSSSSLSTIIYNQEAKAFLRSLLQECRLFALLMNNGDVWILIQWLTEVLNVMLISSSMSEKNRDHFQGCLDVAHDFLCGLCELVILALANSNFQREQQQQSSERSDHAIGILKRFLDIIMGRVIPKYSRSNFSLQIPLNQMCIILKLLAGSGTKISEEVYVADSTMYEISTVCLVLQDEIIVGHMLSILASLLKLTPNSRRNERYGRLVWGGVYSLGRIFHSVSCCASVAEQLMDCASQVLEAPTPTPTPAEIISSKNPKPSAMSTPLSKSSGRHIFDIFNQSICHDDSKQLLSFAETISFDERDLSILEQCEYLLLGLSTLSLMIYSECDSDRLSTFTYTYLTKLVNTRYRHLGRRIIPIVIATLQNVKVCKDLMQLLEFTCVVLSGDPSCGHAVFTLLAPMSSQDSPRKVRCMAVRLYPLLCKSNKRLYPRICVSLAEFATHPTAQLRIAAAATICELAEFDLIRDVTDVIGWVQNFLGDDEHLATHFSVMTLHHFVEAGELDYSMVIKVLNKKLVDVADINAILELPDIVIEALVKLLGDGEDGDRSDSDDSSESGKSEIVISQQVQTSVSTLIVLSSVLSKSMLSSGTHKIHDRDTTQSLLRTIYLSLSRYSLTSIGVMAEMVRKESADSEPYDSLKIVIQEAFDISVSPNLQIDVSFTEAWIELAKHLLLFEQDSILLWHKTKVSTKNSQTKDLSDALQHVPDAVEGTVAYFLLSKLTKCLSSGQQWHEHFSLSFECLKVVSLPSAPMIEVLNFALIAEIADSSMLKKACINMVTAQLSIARRSAVERKEYIQFSINCARNSSDILLEKFGTCTPLFFESLGTILPQMTSGVVDELLPILWGSCTQLHSLTRIAFLNALHLILHSKKPNISIVNTIQNALTTYIFSSICDESVFAANGTARSVLFSCLSDVPVNVLEESNILSFGSVKTDIARAELIAHLFSRRSPTKLKSSIYLRAALWVAKQKINKSTAYLQTVSIQIAKASCSIPMKKRVELINTLLENMIVNGMNNYSIQILLFYAICLTRPGSIKCNIDSASDLFAHLLNDSSQEAGDLSHQLEISDSMSRNILSIIQKQDAKDLHLPCLTTIFLSSNSSQTSALQHALVSASICCSER